MEYTLNDKYKLIKKEILNINSKNPIKILKVLMKKDFINIHGPEHHYLDGASFLVAFKNAGGKVDLINALDELAKRTINMPGAMCGHWGVCGSTTSVGAALSIIHEVSPLSSSIYYNDNMEYISLVIQEIGKIGGPRCCKRNAFIALSTAVKFFKDKYGVIMELDDIVCDFSSKNKQCISIRCPYFKSDK